MQAASGLRRRRWAWLLGLPLLLACTLSVKTGGGTATPFPPTWTPWPTPPPLPSPTPEPADTGWQPGPAGLAWRQWRVETGDGEERLTLVRLDPDQVRFRVLYAPEAPRPLHAWAEALPEALLVVNAGYFTPQYQATGLLISGGVVHGTSYGDFAGMFAVTPEGEASVRWLRTAPYSSDELLAEAVQSFPMLIRPGGQVGFPAGADDGRPARRTVVAQDRQGRILFLVAPRGAFTLRALALFLARSDLELDSALNLDGGTSTGLWLRLEEGRDAVEIDSLASLPAVIAVFRRR